MWSIVKVPGQEVRDNASPDAESFLQPSAEFPLKYCSLVRLHLVKNPIHYSFPTETEININSN